MSRKIRLSNGWCSNHLTISVTSKLVCSYLNSIRDFDHLYKTCTSTTSIFLKRSSVGIQNDISILGFYSVFLLIENSSFSVIP